MKLTHLFIAVFGLFLAACGGNKEAQNTENETVATEEVVEEAVAEEPAEEVAPAAEVDLSAKGIGPVTSLELPAEIDDALAAKGKEIFDTKCMVCHKVAEKFIGPAPKGILEKRSPEWVMNMILNPTEMTQKDPAAMALFKEYNNMPMTDTGITEEEARSVLEYFRTL